MFRKALMKEFVQVWATEVGSMDAVIGMVRLLRIFHLPR